MSKFAAQAGRGSNTITITIPYGVVTPTWPSARSEGALRRRELSWRRFTFLLASLSALRLPFASHLSFSAPAALQAGKKNCQKENHHWQPVPWCSPLITPHAEYIVYIIYSIPVNHSGRMVRIFIRPPQITRGRRALPDNERVRCRVCPLASCGGP